MDDSPEPTIMLNSMKEFNRFLGYGNHNSKKESLATQSPRQKLNFSNDDTESNQDDSFSSSMSYSRKRKLNDMTGIDIVKKFRKKEQELVEAQTTISKLESRTRKLDLFNEKSRLDYDLQIDSLQKQQIKDKELILDFQHKLQQLESKEREKLDISHSDVLAKDALIRELKNKCNMFQCKYNEQNNKYQTDTFSLNDKIYNYEKEIEQKKAQHDMLEDKNQELELELAMVKRKLRDSGQFHVDSEKLTSELEIKDAKIKRLEMDLEQLGQYQKEQDLYTSEAKQNRILVREAMKLKEEVKHYELTVANTQLLQEQLSTADLKIDLLEKRVEHLNDLHSGCDDIKTRFHQLESIILKEFDLSEMIPLADLKQRLALLKKSDTDINNSLAELQASLQSIEMSKNVLEQQNQNLSSQIEQQKTNLQTNAQLIKRLQRKLMLVSKERDGLKEINNTYESEATINPASYGNDRILRLEEQLTQYKNELKKLEIELDNLQGLNQDENDSSSRKEDLEKIQKLEERVSQLENQVRKLEHEKLTLEDKIEGIEATGAYNPATTRILHFKNNPYAQAVEDRQNIEEKLRKEVMALKERIKLMEEGEANITQKVGFNVSNDPPNSKKLQELQEKLQSQEKQTERLLAAFKKKSLQMREIVYILTGYRFDGKGETKYKVSHVYADSPEEYLLFEILDDGEMQMLDTEYASTLQDLIQEYLSCHQSYPAMLAALTLKLFNRQTKLHASSSEQEEEEDDDDDVEDPMDQDSEDLYPPGEGEQEREDRHHQNQQSDDERDSMSERASHQGEDEYEEEGYAEEEEEEEDEGGEEEEPEDELICLD